MGIQDVSDQQMVGLSLSIDTGDARTMGMGTRTGYCTSQTSPLSPAMGDVKWQVEQSEQWRNTSSLRVRQMTKWSFDRVISCSMWRVEHPWQECTLSRKDETCLKEGEEGEGGSDDTRMESRK